VIQKRSPRTLGRNIRRLRRARGLTQEQLGTRVGGADKSHISRIEAGRIDPTLSTARAIAKALGVSLDDLAGIEPLSAQA
jgi:transcriptional regulator with XRE-family HTH domain